MNSPVWQPVAARLHGKVVEYTPRNGATPLEALQNAPSKAHAMLVMRQMYGVTPD